MKAKIIFLVTVRKVICVTKYRRGSVKVKA